VYIETSGFTAGSAAVIDHAVCEMSGGVVRIPEDIVSSGILNWNGVLPEQLAVRLEADLDRIQVSQNGKPATGPRFPYTYNAVCTSPNSGYATMSPAVATIAAALQQGRTVIGHGLLSFGWQFLAPFLPTGSDIASYDQLLLDHVYDTANIEKAIQDDTNDWLPAPNEPRSSWQRAVGKMRSKSKWSLRSFMFAKYGLQQTKPAYYATDMLLSLVDIMQIWRSEVGQS
jgi:hypothetical protein